MKHVAIAMAFIVTLSGAATGLAQTETRTSTSAGVTVKVTPKNLAADSPAWEFVVVLDTHSQDLSDDLVKSSLIVKAGGERYSPLAWEGAVPGGHHREGVLRFQPIKPAPETIELQIQRPGESTPRVFRWNIN